MVLATWMGANRRTVVVGYDSPGYILGCPGDFRRPPLLLLVCAAAVCNLAMIRTVTLSLSLLLASGADGFIGSGLAGSSLKLRCRTSSDRQTRRLFPAGRSDPSERVTLCRASRHDCDCSRAEEGQKNQVGASMWFLATPLRLCAYLTVCKIDT